MLSFSYLGREADIFQCFILTPAAHDIGERTEGILVEWRSVSRLSGEGDDEESSGEGQDAIHEDEELRVLELPDLSGRVHVLLGHDFLLQDAPG